MKKAKAMVATVLAAVACLGGFAACDKEEMKTVTIGYTDYAPMNYTDENGKLVGFDTELAEQMFKDMGYKVRFKLIEWSNKYMELDSGTIDCVWNGFTANTEDNGVPRSEKVDFSYYYMTNAQCVIRMDSTTELVSASEMVGKSVAYEASSAGDSYVSAVEGNVNKKPKTSQMEAVREVLSGTAQYAVIDLLLAKSIVGKGDYASVKINESIVIDAEYYAIGFKKGSDLTAKINEKLVAYAQNGKLATLAAKYGLSNQVITDYADQLAK